MKAEHPRQQVDDAPFWMVGEFWGLGPARGPLHDAGFDAMINFEFQGRVAALLPALTAGQPAALDPLFTEYAAQMHGRPAHALSYLSSHDTELFDRAHLIEAGTALLLAPGAVQIFYGDEVARPPGIAPRTDAAQATRSDMPWDHIDEAVLAHWRALGSFRARHVAIAHGAHAKLATAPYAFSRTEATEATEALGRGDRVVVAIDVAAGAVIPVGAAFADGEALRDAYTGAAYAVHAGSITAARASRLVLLERAR